MSLLSLVVPVYKNEENIPSLLDAIAQLDRQLGGALEAVFVVDGSPDRSFELLKASLAQASFRSQLVLLSRNFGSFMAIRVGLQHGRGDRYAVMAADLQEPPELVLKMDRILAAGEADVVVAAREARADPLASRLASTVFWSLYRRYVVPEMPPGGVDMFGCNRVFRDTLLQMEERHSSLVAQIFWLGFRRKVVTYKRQARVHGKSAWTLRKKVNYMMDSVFSFTDLPIRLLIRVGGLGTLVACLLGLLAVGAKLLGETTVPGYTVTMLVILFFGSLNLLGLGIVGSYAWRTFENTKKRPLAIPMTALEFGGDL